MLFQQFAKAIFLVNSFNDILAEATVFKNKDALSPHFIPESFPHREKEIEAIMRSVSPALKGERPRNLFVYGKTGTGKTTCAKKVMNEFNAMKRKAAMAYMNCRIYNSRYRILFRLVSEFVPEHAKTGFGLSFLYEKLLDWIEADGKNVVIILDEIDTVKDLDNLVYTFTRSNDDLKGGSLSMLGISNKISFKDRLDPRSKSALYESELVFPPYNTRQLQTILAHRAKQGFIEGVVAESAVNLAAAIVSQETGDARYALKLLQKAGDVANDSKTCKVTDKEVEAARKIVDEDIAVEAISTLPEHQQLVLYGVSNISLSGSKYSRLAENNKDFMLMGEAYDAYRESCSKFARQARSSRWFKEYLNELQLLGLVSTTDSGKGVRGRSTLVKINYPPTRVKEIVDHLLAPSVE